MVSVREATKLECGSPENWPDDGHVISLERDDTDDEAAAAMAVVSQLLSDGAEVTIGVIGRRCTRSAAIRKAALVDSADTTTLDELSDALALLRDLVRPRRSMPKDESTYGSGPLRRRDATRDLDDPAGTLDRPGRIGLRDVVGLVLGPGLHRKQPPQLLGDGGPVGPGGTEAHERFVVVLASGSLPQPHAGHRISGVAPGMDRQAGRRHGAVGVELRCRGREVFLGLLLM